LEDDTADLDDEALGKYLDMPTKTLAEYFAMPPKVGGTYSVWESSSADETSSNIHTSFSLPDDIVSGRIDFPRPPVIPKSSVLWVIIGRQGSGAPSHSHGAIHHMLITGEKTWRLPGHSNETFVQRAGDIVFLPGNIAHSTSNAEDTMAVSFKCATC